MLNAKGSDASHKIKLLAQQESSAIPGLEIASKKQKVTKVKLTGASSTSYNMAARALADLSHEGAKRPSAINQLSARAAML